MHTKNPNPILFLLMLLFFTNNFVLAQYTPGNTYFGTNDYIEYHAGNLPVIFSVPHGGYLEPPSIPDRNCGACVTVRDSRTEELSYDIDSAMQVVFGGYPHVIINKLARIKLDANREIVEAAQGNEEAETAWYEYHDFIQAAKDSCVAHFGSAIFIDLHGHGHEIQRIELGYLISKSELQNSDADLDAMNFQDESSIRHLKNVLNPDTSFAKILRGSECMGEFLVERGYPSVPSASDPAPDPADPYFSGGYNTRRHGSRDSTVINGMQFELNWDDVRDSNANRKAFARGVACAVRSYLDKWFFDLESWDPGHVVTSASDDGPGSLRSALLGAEDGDTITFDPSLLGDTIRLEKELRMCSDITILGPGADLLAISGGDSVRILRTMPGDSVNVWGLSLVRGRCPSGEDGGAVLAEGNFRISNCIVSDNYADDDAGAISVGKSGITVRLDSCIIQNNSCGDDGGALRCIGGNMIINASTIKDNFSPSNGGALSMDGTVTITNSTFSENEASSSGGGIRNFGNGRLSCVNSTFSGNISGNRGGAISSVSEVELDFCTIANNTSTSLGGGIRLPSGGTCTLRNTIISGNTGSSGHDVSVFEGSFISNGYNLVADTTGSVWIPAVGDQLGNTGAPLDPMILLLSDNGGQTETISLQPASPCIDQGEAVNAPSYDQRGEQRIFCSDPDIGAFEFRADTLVWTGAINSDWNNPGNWDIGIVPKDCNVVEIPGTGTAPMQPVIAIPGAACKDLFLRSFSSLRLIMSGFLTIGTD